MKLEDIICTESIKIGLVAKNKKEAISRMVELAAKSGRIRGKDITLLKNQVSEREFLASTAIGNSVAVPHTKSLAVDSITASFAILKTAIPGFDTPDDKPISILLLLLASENLVGKQLRYLNFFSKILSNDDNINKILNFNSEQEIYDFLNVLAEDLDL